MQKCEKQREGIRSAFVRCDILIEISPRCILYGIPGIVRTGSVQAIASISSPINLIQIKNITAHRRWCLFLLLTDLIVVTCF